MIGPSSMGPGSTEVLGENLSMKPGLTRTRTDSQHVRESSPPLRSQQLLSPWTDLKTRGTPRATLGHSLCLASGLSGALHLMDTLRGTNLLRDLLDTLLVGGTWADPDTYGFPSRP